MSSGFHDVGIASAAARVGADPVRGLTADEAALRRERHGPNVLPAARRPSTLSRLAAQLTNPLVLVLIASAAITAAIGLLVDAAVIAGVVIVNAAIGFGQESRAERALHALMSFATARAVVVREGRRTVVDSAEVVPGDVVLLEPGDRVPADMRLIAAGELRVDESMLTGESLPVAKRTATLPTRTIVALRSNVAFAGTLVTGGRGRGIAVATGADTELGRIQRLMEEAPQLETPLTRRLARFSRVLTAAILALAAFTFTLGLARGESAPDMFIAAVALAVGAIPEGLPAAMTITLALGVAGMARRNAIVRRLPAAETLGSTTVVCSDKTGTLTQNRMVVRALWAGGERFEVEGEGYSPRGTVRRAAGDPRPLGAAVHRCLEAGVLCSDARLRFEGGGAELVGDPTEGALLASAARAGLSIEGVRRRHARLDVVPFASERGWMATLDAGPRGEEIQVKGGVEQVLLRSATMADPDGRAVPLDPGRVLDEAATLAAEGYRVIALAAAPPAEATRIDDPELPPLTFLGLQGMLDPPRPEAQAAVARCRDARIAVKMVTGDQLETARAIARRIGISGRREPVAVSGAEIERAERRELPELVERADVFARVSPEQKLRLVEAFQARGEVVAMTGDGVNDAPALRQADLGIAIGGTGTEVAKEASDIVLADDNFATIAAAVEEGRRIFDNITKFLVWTLPTNLGEGLVILAAILVGATLPILPSQILWINMTTAVALGLMLSFEPLEPDAMRRPPRRLTEPLLSGVLIERIVLASGLMVAGSFGLFELELRLGASVEEARTVAVNVFVAAEAFYLLTCRSLSRSFLSVGLFSNRWVVVGVACQVVLQAAFTYLPAMNALFDTAPVAAESWVRIIAVGIAVALVAGAHKAIRRRWSWPATPAAA